MVLPALPIIAACSAAAAAGLVGFGVIIQRHISQHKANKAQQQQLQLSQTINRENESAGGIQLARVKINGELITFLKESGEKYAQYDLAIDYCSQHATLLGLDVERLAPDCIYPLVGALQDQFLKPSSSRLPKGRGFVLSVNPSQGSHLSNQRPSSLSSHKSDADSIDDEIEELVVISNVSNKDKASNSNPSPTIGATEVNNPNQHSSFERLHQNEDSKADDLKQFRNKAETKMEESQSEPPNSGVSELDKHRVDSSSNMEPIGVEEKEKQAKTDISSKATDENENAKNINSVEGNENNENIPAKDSAEEVPSESSADASSVITEKPRVYLEVNGVNYVFEYELSESLGAAEAAAQLASDFCAIHGKSLLQKVIEKRQLVKDEDIAPIIKKGCSIPLKSALEEKILASTASA